MGLAAAITFAVALAAAAPAGPGFPVPPAPATPPHAPTDAPPPGTPDWAQDAVDYVRDPLHNRQLLKRFARQDPVGLPPLVLLLLADARFRAGQHRAAVRLLDQVLVELPDGRGTSARQMLAVIALAGGDVDRLAELRDPLAEFSPGAGQLAELLRGLALSATEPGDAAAALDHLAADPRLAPALRAPAAYAAGLAHFWSGDFAGADVRFERLAHDRDAGPLADDARYAAAIASWQQGAQQLALDALAALAATAEDRRTPGASRSRIMLERRTVLRGGVRALRRAALVGPEAVPERLLDADAAALARRALELLSTGRPPTARAAGDGALAVTLPTGDAAPSVPSSRQPAAPSIGAQDPAAERPATARWSRGWIALLVVLLGVCAWALAQRATRSVPANRRARER